MADLNTIISVAIKSTETRLYKGIMGGARVREEADRRKWRNLRQRERERERESSEVCSSFKFRVDIIVVENLASVRRRGNVFPRQTTQ